ncbi:hypothetical protein AB4028_12800 [Janibacter sp. RAF20_2_2]|uniref:hypothetical protein n=1 Tax=unclassified Janibacter TaxID=2649294 RepID=UPI003F92D87D
MATAEPGLRELLVSARERGELDDALLTLWILVGQLLIATHDPSVAELVDPRDSVEHLASLERVIRGLG